MAKRTMDKSLLFLRMLRIVEKRNATLLTNEYISAKSHVRIVCSEGHTFRITPDNLGQGKWCRDCSVRARAEKRLKKKGLSYLKKLGRQCGLESLASVYEGVKYKHEWRCLRCGNVFAALPDNIKWGKNCPKCARGMGKVIRPEQRGPLINIPAGFFGKNTTAVCTFAETQVQFTGTTRKHYESRGYRRTKINSPLWVKSTDLPPTSAYEIYTKCSRCGEGVHRSLGNATKSMACPSCKNDLIAESNRLDPRDFEELLGVKISDYRSVKEDCTITKPCGCIIRQSLEVVRMTGVGYCSHDSEKTWRTFEIKLRESLGGRKGSKARDGEAIDCITPTHAIEFKLNINAVVQNYGRRNTMAKVEDYRKWAKKKGLMFFVVVNEPELLLRGRDLPRYYVGWERWVEAGLTPRDVAFGRELKERPHEFRNRTLTATEKRHVSQYLKLTSRLGRQPSVSEVKEFLGFTFSYLSRVVVGKKSATQAEIASALSLDVSSRHASSKVREAALKKYKRLSEKAGYLLPPKECEKQTGQPLYSIMRWAIGGGRFDMEALAGALGATVGPKGRFRNPPQRYKLDGIYYSEKELAAKLGCRAGFVRGYRHRLSLKKKLVIPSGDVYESGHRNSFPKKYWGKIVYFDL